LATRVAGKDRKKKRGLALTPFSGSAQCEFFLRAAHPYRSYVRWRNRWTPFGSIAQPVCARCSSHKL